MTKPVFKLISYLFVAPNDDLMYLRISKLSYKIQNCFSEIFRNYMYIVTLCCQSAQKPDESGLTSFLCDFVAQVSQKWSVKNLLSNHRTKRIFAEDNLSLRRRFHELFVYFHAESMLRLKNLHTIFKAFFSQYFLIKYLNFIVKFIISTIPLNNIVNLKFECIFIQNHVVFLKNHPSLS